MVRRLSVVVAGKASHGREIACSSGRYSQLCGKEIGCSSGRYSQLW